MKNARSSRTSLTSIRMGASNKVSLDFWWQEYIPCTVTDTHKTHPPGDSEQNRVASTPNSRLIEELPALLRGESSEDATGRVPFVPDCRNEHAVPDGMIALLRRADLFRRFEFQNLSC